MSQDDASYTLDLSRKAILTHLIEVASRHYPEPGRRQVPFTIIETLLCYGLFSILDPHHYGGANIHTLPSAAKSLATFFRRTPGSITSKMLNLDGSRPHSSRDEPRLFAYLAWDPSRYLALYRDILTTARDLAIGEETLPDFLGYLSTEESTDEDLLGQEELPSSTARLLSGNDSELRVLEQSFTLTEKQTEKFAERKIRLAQHRFALHVLENCGRICVFCGFEPRSLPIRSGLLRASHIKPWAVSDQRERVDVRNGLAACPMHDAAFDLGYLTVNGGYRIHRAHMLQESIVHDSGVERSFGETLSPTLLLPQHARKPAPQYLDYHRERIFKG